MTPLPSASTSWNMGKSNDRTGGSQKLVVSNLSITQFYLECHGISQSYISKLLMECLDMDMATFDGKHRRWSTDYSITKTYYSVTKTYYSSTKDYSITKTYYSSTMKCYSSTNDYSTTKTKYSLTKPYDSSTNNYSITKTGYSKTKRDLNQTKTWTALTQVPVASSKKRGCWLNT